MKIDQNGIVPSSSGVENSTPLPDAGSRSKGAGGASSGVQDQTQFSSLGTTASQLRSTLNSVPEVRQDRVNYYRQQIASGSYKVDAHAVAGSILQETDGSKDGN